MAAGDYDLVILGCGPAGERAAITAARAGKRVAVVERHETVGGNRVNWGTIPSKTLRESALFVHALTRNRLHGIRCEITDEVTVADFMYRERLVVTHELELIGQSLGRYRVEVVRGHARFRDARTVDVTGPDGAVRTLGAGVVLIATGSRPNRPADVPFDGVTVFDSDSILRIPAIPRRMIVYGAGVIGVEYASIFAALGVQVSLLDTRDRLLPYLDREIVAILEREMLKLGVTVSSDERYESIERLSGNPPLARIATRKGDRTITRTATALLYCAGRDGNTDDLGLERLGLVPGKYGLLDVDDVFRTKAPGVYAVGDVIGYPALASTAMEQGRRAVRHAFSLPGPTERTGVLPFAIYSIPEVSYIGETEEALKAKGVAYVAGRGNYELNPRGQIVGDDEGIVKLLFERPSGRLLGAHIVGNGASELIHLAQAYLLAGTTAGQISESIFNYPTLSDLLRHAALVAALELKKPA